MTIEYPLKRKNPCIINLWYYCLINFHKLVHFIFFSIIVFALTANDLYAQRSRNDDYFGISARFAFPQQNFGNYQIGYGALLMDELVLSQTISIAAEIGFWQFSAKDNIPAKTAGAFEHSLRTVSLMGGIKYYFGNFYLMSFTGLLFTTFESKLIGESIFSNQAGLGIQGSVGWHYGILDVAAEYTLKISRDPLRSWMGIRLGVYLLDLHF